MPENLEELTHNEMIRSLILLNQNKSFEGYRLKQKLDILSDEHPRLKNSGNSVGNILFFYFPFLGGDMTSPYYRLSREGKNIFQEEFERYNPSLQEELKELALKVWN